MSHRVTAVKGHGTENDFIVLPDLEAVLSLSPELVRGLCDRHAGLGADGVLRVVRTEHATEPDIREQAGVAEYFMDYHNADGSIAEMCGNGARVFGRYLQSAGLIAGPTVIATRGGPRRLSFSGSAISVELGRPALRTERPSVTSRGGAPLESVAVDLPNPHVVVELSSAQELADLDLSVAPEVQPGLPEGQNVEFFTRLGPHRLRMRVHERGVGETRSCGTGICAVVTVAALAAGDIGSGDRTSWQVEVAGGQCEVSWTDAGEVVLTGPAVFVGSVLISDDWLAEHR